MSAQFESPIRLAPAFAVPSDPSPTLSINERVHQMWAQGETVYHLGFGESRFPVHPKIQEALRINAHQKSYLAGQGLAELRVQAASFYSHVLETQISPEQVIIGPGSKAVLYAALMALDAALILPTPCWVSYAPQAHLLNRPVYHVAARPADHYALTLDALDATVRQVNCPSKLLLVTSPNNPTGQMFEARFLKDLADYCRQNSIVVLSDEIYGLVSHGHRPHVSISRYFPEGTIVLSGLSKHLSLGGWRLGVAILPAHDEGARLMSAMRVIASEIWSTPTGPVQYAGITAFGDDGEIAQYIQECSQIHAIRTQYLWRQLCAMGACCARPDGGFYTFPNFDHVRGPLARRGVRSSSDLAKYLLNTYRLATLPGTAFNTPPEDLSLRLASSYLDMETDQQAQKILDSFRQNPDPETLMRDHHPTTQEAIRRFEEFIATL